MFDLRFAYPYLTVAAMLMACQSATSSSPQIDSLNPGVVSVHDDTDVALHGSAFSASVHISLDDDDPPLLDRGFLVQLGDTLLAPESIALVSDTELAIRVPGGLTLGFHDVTVIAPDGQRDVLENGLQVIDDAALTISIEDAPGGSGTRVTAQQLGPVQTITVYAIGRSPVDDSFVQDVDVTWSMLGDAVAEQLSGSSTTVTPTAPGTATLTAEHPVHGTATATFEILRSPADNTPPVAEYVIDRGGGTTATVFTFDASSSWDREDDNATLTFEWDWDGDQTFDATGMIITHAFPTLGLHQVTLRVTDPSGLRAYFHGAVYVATPTDMVLVDTPSDADDDSDNETSLREALAFAEGRSNPTLIVFSDDHHIDLGTSSTAPGEQLPAISGPGPVYLMGHPGVVIDGGAISTTCLDIHASDSVIMWMDIQNCPGDGVVVNGDRNLIAHTAIHNAPQPITLSGSDNEFGPGNLVFTGQSPCIGLQGPRNQVIGNHVWDCDTGIMAQGQSATDSVLIGNLVRNSLIHGIRLQNGSAGTRVQNNTLYGNGAAGISVESNEPGNRVLNNILAENTGPGIRETGDTDALDHNLYWNNGNLCVSCTLGSNAQFLDPQFIDPVIIDLRVHSGSPGIDSGLDDGLDVNGKGPGRFHGLAPDIGRWEAPAGY